MWPSSDLADIAFRRLEAHRHPFPFRHLKYPGAGHTILVPYWPLTAGRVYTLQVEGLRDVLLTQGGSVKADAEAGIEARLPHVSRRRGQAVISRTVRLTGLH
jgi:BAAT / Acyl-CoA thioester hydrolase C terminal